MSVAIFNALFKTEGSLIYVMMDGSAALFRIFTTPLSTRLGTSLSIGVVGFRFEGMFRAALLIIKTSFYCNAQFDSVLELRSFGRQPQTG